MKTYKIILLLVAIAVAFSACNTSKRMQRKARKAQTENVTNPSGNPDETVGLSEQLNPQATPTPSYPYDWVSYRGSVNINFDEKKYQCNYYLVNRTDSILYLNLNFMGIEFARLVATPQEVTFVNKMSSEYYQGDYTFVEKYLKMPADFYALQAVFNGDEAKLKAYKDITVSYHPVIDEATKRPFFDSFSISMNGGQRQLDAKVQNLKFNTPGPTGIKIPESFKKMKL